MNSSQVPLLLEIRKNDPLFDVKCTFYRRDLSVPQRRVRVCVSDNENTKLLLALLRVIEADRYYTTKYALLMLCSDCVTTISLFYHCMHTGMTSTCW